MKAIVCTKYGPPEVLQLREVEKPVPTKKEVCIKVVATSVTASDTIIRDFKLPFWHPVGFMMALKPDNVSFEEAAAVPYGGLLAMHYIKKGNIQSGQKVLIYGASGSIGTSAVQLARHFGAEVTGVCSTTNLEMVRSLGANAVIDYTKEEVLDRGEVYDFILDAVGRSKSSNFKLQCKKALAPNGKYLSVDDGSPKGTLENLLLLKELVESGELEPVIDTRYPLEQMVEAHSYVDKGHKKGNVVITI